MKRKRRMFRFSIRTMLIAITLFGAAGQVYVSRVNRQCRVVSWGQAMGGDFRYAYQYNSKGDFDSKRQLPFPGWLNPFVDVDYFSSVVMFECHEDRLIDIAPLADLPQLKILRIGGTHVGDLAPLSQLETLRYLFIAHTNVVDLTPLDGLPHLTLLKITGVQFSTEELARIEKKLPRTSVSEEYRPSIQ